MRLSPPGDDSPYVVSMRRLLLVEAAPRLGAALDRSRFGFFCEDGRAPCCARFIYTIYKLRK